jgi:hypothetical protein
LDATPQPTLQNTPAPAGGYSPPPDAPSPGQARLDVQVRRETPERAAVGEFARFQVTVTNLGTGTARNTQFRVRFDRGLRHREAPPGEYEIVSDAAFDLAPNESKTMPLTFAVVAGGNQCHEVTVTAQDTEPARATGCVTGAQATLEVTATGPRTRVVGEIGEFRATIKNTGDVEAKNVELVVRFEPPLEPEMVPSGGHERLQDGGILFRIPSLPPGTPKEFNLTARCRTSSNSACAKFFVTAEGGVLAASEACVEILPPRPAGAETGAATADLRITVAASANPARTGQKFPLTVNMLNAGEQTIGPVELRVILPVQLTPDTTQIQPEGQVVVQGQMIAFAPVPQLAAQQTVRYLIPVTAGISGDVRVYASARAGGAGGASEIVNAVPIDVRILPQ